MHHIIPVVFFLTASVVWTSSSSLSFTTEDDIEIYNVTLPFGSRFQDDCNSNCTYEECCLGDSPLCFCCKGLSSFCAQRCYSEGRTCDAESKLCCSPLECINYVCRNYETGIDFVTVAKIALAAALIITMVAVLSICYKGFIRPRCAALYGSPPEEDNESVNSVRRYVRQLMDNRPPRYEFQPEKPPSYEECVGAGSVSGASSLSDPPPYSVAVSVAESSQEQNATALPSLYVMDENAPQQSDLLPIPLNVQCFQIQDSASVSSTGDLFISSPITDMDDFVAFSESDSVDSISYSQLNSETQTIVEAPSLEHECGGIDNAVFVPDDEHQHSTSLNAGEKKSEKD